MGLYDQISFHDAGVNGITEHGNSICVSLESVSVGGQPRNATVCFEGVREITSDGQSVEALTMEFNDGEILTLESLGGTVHLIIEWTDFAGHRSITRSYRILCDETTVTVL